MARPSQARPTRRAYSQPCRRSIKAPPPQHRTQRPDNRPPLIILCADLTPPHSRPRPKPSNAPPHLLTIPQCPWLASCPKPRLADLPSRPNRTRGTPRRTRQLAVSTTPTPTPTPTSPYMPIHPDSPLCQTAWKTANIWREQTPIPDSRPLSPATPAPTFPTPGQGPEHPATRPRPNRASQ